MLYCENKRISFVDIVKATAIFLVILGHSPLCDNQVKQWIYSFHMPLFFAAYGLTYNIEKHRQQGFFNKVFGAKKIKRLMLPAMIWAVVYAPLTFKNVAYIIYGSQATLKSAGSLTSIWFLPCMFLSVCFFEVLLGLFEKFCKGERRNWIIMWFFAFVLGFISYMFPQFSLGYPWCINLVPMATAFILVGYLLQQMIKKTKVLNEAKKPLVWASICVGAFLILTLTFQKNLAFITINNADMASANFGNYGLYMLDAISGIVMMVALAVLLSKIGNKKSIVFVANNTLPIFLIHKPIITGISTLFRRGGVAPGMIAVFLAVVVLIICCVITQIINRVLPEMIGNLEERRMQ